MGAVHVQDGALWMNPAAERVIGYARSEITTIEAWFRTLYDDTSGAMLTRYEAQREAGFPKMQYGKIRRKDGQERLLEYRACTDVIGAIWIMDDITERAAMEVRHVIRSLRQGEATEYLLPAVSERLADWSEKRPETVHVRINGPDNPVPILIHGEVLRMLDELLNNIERHASAQNVWVRLTLSSAAVTLAVRDDGVGFDQNWLDPWADDGHFGLLGARERALILGGHFNLQSTPGVGTEVTIDISLTSREEPLVHVL